MSTSFREFVADLRAAGQLREITKPVDIRHIAALVDQSETALMFSNVIGYDMPVISGLTNSRDRLAIAMDCEFSEIEGKLRQGIDRPIEPKIVNSGGSREVLVEGDDVDLYNLPVPLFSIRDGGPMITAGITLAEDPELGLNAGIYRLLVKDRNTTGIDIVTPNNLRKLAEKAYERNEPLPISVNIGTHPAELITGCFKAAPGVSEIAMSGGMRGEAVELTPCKTISTPCIADAEIVLEAEILPTGWTKPEGRFGEFTRLMGGLHWNPHVRIKAISMRRDAMYYALHMPWENIWPSGPIYEAAVRRALHEAGVQVTAVNITPGGCCHWHAVIAVKPLPGDAKNAMMAALSVADMKHVVVVDEEIDVFDGVDVEWAIATRVQADKDVMIVSGARSKPLDPSLVIVPGHIPTTSKMGIDATISDDIPRERYERIAYAYADQINLEDMLGEGGTKEGVQDISPEVVIDLSNRIRTVIEKEPLYYAILAERFADEGFQAVGRALGLLHERGELWQDHLGQFCLVGSEFAAVPPQGRG